MSEAVGLLGAVVGFVRELVQAMKETKHREERRARERIAVLLESASAACLSFAEDVKSGGRGRFQYSELEKYVERFRDVADGVIDTESIERVQAQLEYARKVDQLPHLHFRYPLFEAEDQKRLLGEIETAAGEFRALATLVRTLP